MKKTLGLIVSLVLFIQIKSSDDLSNVNISKKSFLINSIVLPNRNCDLVIINDVTENVTKDWRYIGYPFTDDKVGIPMMFKLLYALQENQLVLTTKSLFYQIQLMAEKWDDFALPEEDFLRVYDQKYRKYLLAKPKSQSAQSILQETKYNKIHGFIHEFDTIYTHFLHGIHNGEDYNIRMNNLLQSVDLDDAKEIILLFLYKILYQYLLDLGYQCKNVNRHYILFIPQDLYQQAEEFKSPQLVDLFIGLQCASLQDYDYNGLYNRNKYNILQDALSFEQIGIELLAVLNNLLLPYELHKYNHAKFNIFLTGHGQENYIAEVYKNTFHQILKLFQNRLQMKSLTIDTCSIGGKQFTEIYDIKDMYTSDMLSFLTYPILFIGSFYTPTLFNFGGLKNNFTSNFDQQKLKPYNYFKRLFYFLNENPPSYYQALIQWENIFYNESINKNYISNYVSIKFPHALWIQQSDYDKRVKKLSKVEVNALGKQKMIISKDKKIILLSANVISSQLECEVLAKNLNEVENNIPLILPVNYNKQQYMISELRLPNIILPIFANRYQYLCNILQQMFLSLAHQVKEPIDIVIEKFIVGGFEIQDIHVNVREGIIVFYDPRNNYYYKMMVDEKYKNTFVVANVSKLDHQKFIQNIKDKLKDEIMVHNQFQNFIQQMETAFSANNKKVLNQNFSDTTKTVQAVEAQVGKNPSVQIYQKKRVNNPYVTKMTYANN